MYSTGALTFAIWEYMLLISRHEMVEAVAHTHPRSGRIDVQVAELGGAGVCHLRWKRNKR